MVSCVKTHGTIWLRVLLLSVLGVIGAGIVLFLAPHCLGNPLSDLPPEVKSLWLDQIGEAKSLYARSEGSFFKALGFVGLPITTVLILAREVYLRPNNFSSWLFLGLVSLALLMSIYQVRFSLFANIFCLIPWAYWTALVHEHAQKWTFKLLPAAFMIFLSTEIAWFVPAKAYSLFSPSETVEYGASCEETDLVAALNSVPDGVVLGLSNFTPVILAETKHRVLNGNYHRNIEGLSGSIQIFTSNTENAMSKLKDFGIDYLLTCTNSGRHKFLAHYRPDGLLGQISNGDDIPYLEKVDLSELALDEESTLLFFRVNTSQ